MTPEQKKAIAVANARMRMAQTSQPENPYGTEGNAGGAARAAAYGLSGGQVPFGNVITSGIGAYLAKAASPITGDPRTLRDLYDQAQADTKATQEASPNATLVGNLGGILSTLPMLSSKVIGGGSAATEGTRGLINAIPQGLSKVGDIAGRSTFAAPQGAGLLSRAGIGTANTAISGAKNATLAAPVGAMYAAGEADRGNELEAAKDGAMVAGGIAGAIPVAGALGVAGLGSVKNTIGKVASPAIDASKKEIVALANKYNIPIAIDSLTDNRFYKTMISEGKALPFSGEASKGEATQIALNKAVAKTFGQEAGAITPQVISKAYDDIGGQFQSFTKGKTFEVGPEFYSSLEEISNKASRGGYGRDGADFLQENISRVNGLIDETGKIKGDRLDKLRREFSETSRTRYDDLGNLADDFESMLVDVIGQGDKATVKAIQNAKFQYKNLKTVQKIALKDQVDGNIRPDLLTGAVRTTFGETAFAKGKAGELGDIARIGQVIKDKIPNSGTSQRQFAKGLLTGNIGAAIPIGLTGGPVGLLTQAAVTGLSLGGNRILQNRNVNQKVIDGLLNKTSKKALPKSAPKSGLLSGKTGLLEQ